MPSNEPLIQAVEISASAVRNKKTTITPEQKLRTVMPAVADTENYPDEVNVIKPTAEKNTFSKALLTQSQKKSLSANVTRFVISQAVESNEPIGTIDKIHFDSNNIVTLYAYSDINGLKIKLSITNGA